jgi:hypothetical protein
MGAGWDAQKLGGYVVRMVYYMLVKLIIAGSNGHRLMAKETVLNGGDN